MSVSVLDRRLLAAVHDGRPEMAERLVDLGASPDAAAGIHSALTMACAQADDACARTLLMLGANPNLAIQGRLPIFWAAHSDQAESVALLLAAGADMEAKDASSGRSALHFAAAAGAERSARRILEAGANPNSLDATGRSALHESARLESPAISAMLLGAGADASIQDEQGDTPLHFANRANARLLALADAPAMARNRNGQFPLDAGRLSARLGAQEAREERVEFEARLFDSGVERRREPDIGQ